MSCLRTRTINSRAAAATSSGSSHRAPTMNDRRTFLAEAVSLVGLLTEIPASAWRQNARPTKTILLRSSWQTVNIGDIGHTPGVLRLIERHLPGVDVRLWPSDVGKIG